jgi:glutamyl-tRNA synthetase
MHIGGLRTALYNYLFAKKNHGAFILRIEDTDQKRTVPGALEEIITILNAYGLAYDEGPILVGNNLEEKGNHGPYVQSKRLEHYKKATKELLEQGSAYRCFCTTERLNALRQSQEKQNLPPGYDGFCRNLPNAEIERNIKAGMNFVVRFMMPREGKTEIIDLIRGQVSFNHIVLEDAVLQKSDGFPTYHLANVVDDHLMEISHVIRGEEWLPSLPLHFLIYKTFNWQPPEFAHLPLMLSPTHKKLSKRDGDTAAKDYLKEYLPNAILNFIALLGWNPKNNREFYLTPDEMIEDFEINKINKAGAIFEVKKLNFLNHEHLKQYPIGDLAKKIDLKLDSSELKKYLPMALERAEKNSDIPKLISFLITDDIAYKPELLIPKDAEANITKTNLINIKNYLTELGPEEWLSALKIKEKTIKWIKLNGKSNQEMLWPLRVALSGLEKSPDVFDIAYALGKGKTLSRIDNAINSLK